MLVAISMEALAERARRELIATGEKVRKRSAETHDLPTPKEEQIACLAPRRPVEPGDRRAALHQQVYGRMLSAQDVRKARDQLSHAASGSAVREMPANRERPA
jgi:hypothetical protein